MNPSRFNIYMLEQSLMDLATYGEIPHSDYEEMLMYINNIKPYVGIFDEYPIEPKIYHKYRIKNMPEELGKEFHWMMGKVVTVTGERSEINHKYPINYDASEKPNDGFSIAGFAIRGDLLEEIK